ncbi:MAG: CDP-diacylglycerol--glycerol-3-phosphate 3-phosphatidyltransferase [Parasulfuritortus sp.]|jgi:CDP-diacylglycerol--glycerol-3-phosphate 3-phosphatidyltransferase/cardiolipin synthase|nr:CDP-diacylglycerol--glycerol-3-phosphate 3-phosphatidyltransferase [Parasulfuritortus sp.]
MAFNLPNTLTWLRIVLIPLFVVVFYLPGDWLPPHLVNIVATGLFALASATDWLDGWLARKLNQTSAFGAFLDPVADKLMVAAALLVLVDLSRAGIVASLIIIGREIAISALREWMAHEGKSKSVAVSFVGKLKTSAQMLSILLLLYHDPLLGLNCGVIGQWLLDIAAFLTLWSMFHYLRMAWHAMKDQPA